MTFGTKVMNQAKELIVREIGYAPDAFKLLNGYFCLYKPTEKGFNNTRTALQKALTAELNSMEVRPPRERVLITGDVNGTLQVTTETNLADHVLVSGQRHKEEYMPVWLGNHPGWHASGLMVGIIGSRIMPLRKRLLNHAFPRIYELKGRFGFATRDAFASGKIYAKAGYKHVRKDKFQYMMAKIEASQRKQMLTYSGVGLDTEEAFKIAQTGWTPPADKKTLPVIYAIRITDFSLPDFTIEVQCSNETEQFLAELINEIGRVMKSAASCTGIRLTRLGPFSVDHSVLQKHWNLENMIANIHQCNQLMDKYEEQLKKKQDEEEAKKLWDD